MSVAERAREIGVMKAVGATAPRIFKLLLAEASPIAAASWLVAAALALPLTAAVEAVLARKGFLLPVLVVSPGAIADWLALALAGSAVATLLPARRAAWLSVKDAIAEE